MTTLESRTEQSISDRVLAHLDAGLALPGDLYVSQELFDTEMTHIFGRQWMYAAHVSQLPNPGDFVTVQIGSESAIIVRDRDGEVHGLLNVCRHRGARLTQEPCGSARRFTCPYHQWTYGHDGHLVGAPRMPGDFEKSDFPLKTVQVAVWQGCIFINFSPTEPEDLEGLLSESTALMAPFEIASARVAHTEVYEVAANWKLVWENSQECYHCNANHPEFIRTFDMSSFTMRDPVEAARSFTDDRRLQYGTFPLKTGAESLTMSGAPACGRPLGEFANGTAAFTAATHLKPGFAAVFSPDYGIIFTDVPVAVDRTEVRVQWLVHPEAVQDLDYSVDDLIRVWDQTNRQDWELCRSVQEGVRSARFEPGPLSLDESSVAGFYYAYARMLAAADL